ncbi:MAG: conjugative transfer signal peptidase TraF [Aeromonas sp.]
MGFYLKRLGVALAGAGVISLALLALCAAAGMRVNSSKSVPLGIYWQITAPIRVGAYVLWCPPEWPLFAQATARGYIGAGFCPGGYGYLIKRVAAAAVDRLHISAQGVQVNGHWLAHSQPLPHDNLGRPLPRYALAPYRLAAEQVLLMSDVSHSSFDSRYFGPIARQQIRAVLRPMWTW